MRRNGYGEYGDHEDITDNVPGAEAAGLRIVCDREEYAGWCNPRDHDGNACLYLPGGRDYVDIDERGEKPGCDLRLDKMIRDPQYGWVEEEFEWNDDWEETARRLEKRGCVVEFVEREPYNGGVRTCGGSRADGIIFATPEMMREWFNKKRITKDIRAKVMEGFAGEVEEYGDWATGEVYFVEILDRVTDEQLDSCGGFIGYDYARKDAAIEMASYWITEMNRRKAMCEQPWSALDAPLLIGEAA